jgi:hypothetical protein
MPSRSIRDTMQVRPNTVRPVAPKIPTTAPSVAPPSSRLPPAVVGGAKVAPQSVGGTPPMPNIQGAAIQQQNVRATAPRIVAPTRGPIGPTPTTPPRVLSN